MLNYTQFCLYDNNINDQHSIMITLGAGLHPVLAFAGTVGKGAAESRLGATGRSLSIKGEQWLFFGWLRWIVHLY